MPVTVRVGIVRADQLKRLAEGLRSLAASDIFKGIRLTEQMDDALSHIKDISRPWNDEGHITRDYRRNSLGIADALKDTNLSETWRIRRVTDGNRLTFQIWSTLETVGGPRGRAKLHAIEEGNTAGGFVARSTFTFKGTRGFTTIKQGRFVERPAREGKHYVLRTSEYIKTVLMPQIREAVNLRVRQELEKR